MHGVCKYCRAEIMQAKNDPWFHVDTGEERCGNFDEFASPEDED